MKPMRTLFISIFLTVCGTGTATPLSIPEPWDLETLQAQSSAWREPPHWPYALMLPMEMKMVMKPRHRVSKKADILIWASPKTKRVRSLMLVPENTFSKHIFETKAFRKMAVKHDMVLIYIRKNFHSTLEGGGDLKYIQAILDRAAILLEKPGIRQAPWVVFGQSSQGRFPFYLMWAAPERTIAGIASHAEVPHWPMQDWSKLEDHTIPYVNINGHKEWMGTWYRHVRPHFLNYRTHTGLLPHQVVIPHLGHGNYQDAHGSKGWGQPVEEGHVSIQDVWRYIALYTDQVTTLRLPTDQFPADGPVTLRQIPPEEGVWVHPRAPEFFSNYKTRPIRQGLDGSYTVVDHVKEPHEVYTKEPVEMDPAAMVLPHDQIPSSEVLPYFWMPDREWVDLWMTLQTPGR